MFPRSTRPLSGTEKSVVRLRSEVDVPYGDAPLRAIETLLISGGRTRDVQAVTHRKA